MVGNDQRMAIGEQDISLIPRHLMAAYSDNWAILRMAGTSHIIIQYMAVT